MMQQEFWDKDLTGLALSGGQLDSSCESNRLQRLDRAAIAHLKSLLALGNATN